MIGFDVEITLNKSPLESPPSHRILQISPHPPGLAIGVEGGEVHSQMGQVFVQVLSALTDDLQALLATSVLIRPGMRAVGAGLSMCPSLQVHIRDLHELSKEPSNVRTPPIISSHKLWFSEDPLGSHLPEHPKRS